MSKEHDNFKRKIQLQQKAKVKAYFQAKGYAIKNVALSPIPEKVIPLPFAFKKSEGQPPPYRADRILFSEQHTDPATISGVRILSQPITANEILGSNINEVRDRPALKGLDLATTPMRWAAIDRQKEGTTEYLGVSLKLINGLDFNKILFSNATGGLVFGLDSYDIWSDWGSIGGMEARRGRHEGMGLAWDIFGRDLPLFRFLIGRDALKQNGLSTKEPKPMLLSVTRWVNGPGGRSFIYDLPESGIPTELVTEFLKDKPEFNAHLPEPQCYNPIVGILGIGHLDASVRKNWRSNYGYKQEDETRGNGSTQAGVQTLRFDSPFPKWYRLQDGLLNGEFVRRTEALIEVEST